MKQPLSMLIFPHQKAKKSPFQQHAVSYNPIVGPNQLKHRLSRINKPKSYPSSNTQCPITRFFRTITQKSQYKTNTFCPLTPKPRAERPGAFLAVERMTGIEPA